MARRRYTPGRVWLDKDARMARAAELRGQGLSLRASARRIGVSYQTVANDLARWDRDHAEVSGGAR